MKSLSILVLSILVSACAGTSSVAPTFCTYATSAEAQAAAQAILATMPEGPDKDKAVAAAGLAHISADAVCVMVKAIEAQRQAQAAK